MRCLFFQQILQQLETNEPCSNLLARAIQESNISDSKPLNYSKLYQNCQVKRPSYPSKKAYLQRSKSPKLTYKSKCQTGDCEAHFDYIHLMHKRSKDRLYHRCQAEVKWLRQQIELLWAENQQLLAEKNSYCNMHL